MVFRTRGTAGRFFSAVNGTTGCPLPIVHLSIKIGTSCRCHFLGNSNFSYFTSVKLVTMLTSVVVSDCKIYWQKSKLHHTWHHFEVIRKMQFIGKGSKKFIFKLGVVLKYFPDTMGQPVRTFHHPCFHFGSLHTVQEQRRRSSQQAQ